MRASAHYGSGMTTATATNIDLDTDADAALAAQWVTDGCFGTVARVDRTHAWGRYAVTTTDGQIFFVMVDGDLACRVY